MSSSRTRDGPADEAVLPGRDLEAVEAVEALGGRRGSWGDATGRDDSLRAMAEIDSLPADQRAALQLLLKQGQSYDQLASLLGIGPDAVRSRAHAAVDTLGPESGLSESDRARVADYVLGQQSALRSRRHARDARGLRGRPRLGPARSPAPCGRWPGTRCRRSRPRRPPRRRPKPRRPRPRRPRRRASPPATRRPRPPRSRPRPPADDARRCALPRPSQLAPRRRAAARRRGHHRRRRRHPDHQRGGEDGSGKKSSTLSTKPGTTTTGSQQRPIAQVNLTSASGDPKQVGLAQIFENGNRRAIIVAGQGLSPGAYALWLYNSKSDAKLLGFVPQRVGSDGRFATQGELPSNADKWKQLIVTKEKVTSNTRKAPTEPGEIVLQGDLKLS